MSALLPASPCSECGYPITDNGKGHASHCRLHLVITHDLVNSPQHYTNHPSGVECIAITEHMNFCLGNAMKYIWRAGLKDSSSRQQDLEKAVWYLKRELARES